MLATTVLTVAAAQAEMMSAGPMPLGWTRHSAVPTRQTVAFDVCLKQQNLHQLFESALDVSTPGHPRYGKFLTVPQIERLTAPTPGHMAAVTESLRLLRDELRSSRPHVPVAQPAAPDRGDPTWYEATCS